MNVFKKSCLFFTMPISKRKKATQQNVVNGSLRKANGSRRKAREAKNGISSFFISFPASVFILGVCPHSLFLFLLPYLYQVIFLVYNHCNFSYLFFLSSALLFIYFFPAILFYYLLSEQKLCVFIYIVFYIYIYIYIYIFSAHNLIYIYIYIHSLRIINVVHNTSSHKRRLWVVKIRNNVVFLPFFSFFNFIIQPPHHLTLKFRTEYIYIFILCA